jgi:two-component system, chemotaxis family, CheB/CheR fusion protein
MPRAAIMTGSVDFVLAVAKIPEVFAKHLPGADSPPSRLSGQATAEARLPEMIDLLRARTAHDFTLYKPGTLLRRIERRMIMASVALSDADRYLQILRSDQDEFALLVKDLLINFTSFFRDPKVFELLAQKIIPDLVAATHPTSRSESGLPVAAQARKRTS